MDDAGPVVPLPEARELVVRMPAELHERARLAAAEDDRSLSSLVRIAVRQYLDRREVNG